MTRPTRTLGSLGLTLAAIALVPASADAASVSFTTPGTTTFLVPNNVTHLTVAATGAGGGLSGAFSSCTAGKGGSGQATFSVTPGTQLSITVAGKGGDGGATAGGTGGIGGGGAGGNAVAGANSSGGGGGGASQVTPSGSSPLLIAAGGGGCGGYSFFSSGAGGNDGAPGGNGNVGAQGGGAGTLTAGGAGGASASPSDPPGGSGSARQGGAGAGAATQNGGGGGAGGGYFGGGGGGGVRPGQGNAGGGGGGSDFVAAGASGISSSSGQNAGDGQVTITYTAQPAPSATTGGATGVTRTAATLHGNVNPEGLASTYRFQFGKTKSYGKQTPGNSAGSGSSGRSVAQAIAGLKPNTVYHYRIVATNASGTTYGQDRTFRTKAPKPPPGPGRCASGDRQGGSASGGSVTRQNGCGNVQGGVRQTSGP